MVDKAKLLYDLIVAHEEAISNVEYDDSLESAEEAWENYAEECGTIDIELHSKAREIYLEV